MGFDDIICDAGIKEKIIDALRPLIGQYKYENWGDLDTMENENRYNAYSLVFHQIHAINLVFAMGATPFPLTTEGKDRCKKMSRKETLTIFLEEVDDQDIQVKVMEHLEPLIEELYPS
tara:strand:+ start:457 stop:810 length:354 start_codon:yes stop_codon:yes gene_type:complete